MQDLFPALGGAMTTLENIVEYITSIILKVKSVFADIDFTILYSWLPSDIAAVITAVIAVLLFLAIFGIVRRILFFLG